jgi:Dienelactone hydrolase family
VRGVVSFHGNLDTPDPADAKAIRAKVLVLHGAADPHVPPTQVEAFRQEMEKAGVDWHLTMYGGAVHAFTHRDAGDDPSRGAAYHERAATRSWAAMWAFFGEVLNQAASRRRRRSAERRVDRECEACPPEWGRSPHLALRSFSIRETGSAASRHQGRLRGSRNSDSGRRAARTGSCESTGHEPRLQIPN